MYLLDTNIHAAFILQDSFEKDASTQAYLSFYDTIPLAERVVPDFILGEFETFIMRVAPSRFRLAGKDKKNLQQLASNYFQLLTTKCLLIVPLITTVHRARDLYFLSFDKQYISFIDCLVLATAEENNYTLVTKDERMMRVAKELKVAFFEPKTS